MKYSYPNIALGSFLLLLPFISSSQSAGNIDSLKLVLREQKADTNKVKTLYRLSFSYVAGSYADSAIVYSQQALDLAEELKDDAGTFWAQITMGEALATLGNYPQALDYDFNALALAKKLNDPMKMCFGNGSLAGCYFYMGDFPTSIKYEQEVIRISELNGMANLYWMWIQLSKAYHSMDQPDSALHYAAKAFKEIKDIPNPYTKSVIYPVLGDAFLDKGKYDSALHYYRAGIPWAILSHTEILLIDNYYGIAQIHKAIGNLDSVLWYCREITFARIMKNYPAGLLKATDLLADIYEMKDEPDSTLKYLRIATMIKDSLTNRQKTIAVQHLIYKEAEKQRDLEDYKSRFRRRLYISLSAGALLALFIAAVIVVRNRRQKQLQTMRNNIADDLHDDIGSTLSSIGIMSELAKSKSPESADLLGSIGESTISIQENMSDIVWALKGENDRFENVLQRMNQFACEILEAKGIALELDSDPTLGTIKLTMKQRKSLYLFFKESINNIARHSGASKAIVSIQHLGSQLSMTIRDNGRGFDSSHNFSGNGMHTLKKRAAELEGNLILDSTPGNGTSLVLQFRIT